MKNSDQLYRKSIVLIVIIGMMLCLVSAVGAGQKPLIIETRPFVGTQTDVSLKTFLVGSQWGVIIKEEEWNNVKEYTVDPNMLIYVGDVIRIGGTVIICGCWNRPVWVKFEADGQIISEELWRGFVKYPTKPPCYREEGDWHCLSIGSHKAQWIAVPGTHTLKMTVDSKNEIYETNERNNSKSVTMTVKLKPHQLPKIPLPAAPSGGQFR